jgi:hypothetical protein
MRTIKTQFSIPDQESFTTHDVLRINKMEPDRFREWVRRGYVVPTVDPSGKQGRKRLFSRVNLYGIALLKRLTDLGLNRWIANQFVEFLDSSQWGEVRQGAIRFLVIRGTPDRERDWGDVLRPSLLKKIDRLEAADILLVVDLASITSAVDAAIF